MSATEGQESWFAGLLRELASQNLGRFSDALKRWQAGPPNDVTAACDRGKAMLCVSEGTEEDFEHDSRLKSYTANNHMFADLLVPLGRRISTPILFWLSPKNSPGAAISRVQSPPVFVISLGMPYAFAEVCSCLNYALAEQGLRVENPWFRRVIEQHGLDPADPSFSALAGTEPERT
jgi:hypothetical protein